MLSRDLIYQEFKNPRLRAQMLELVSTLETASTTATQAKADAASAQSTADQAVSAEVQPFSDLLQAISDLPADQTGMIAIVSTDEVAIYPLSSFMRFLGKGATSARPTGSPGIYFDTTLAAGGKPIFSTGSGYVDSTGTAV